MCGTESRKELPLASSMDGMDGMDGSAVELVEGATTTTGHHDQEAGRGPHDDHVVHSHGQHAGHSTAMFKNRFWLTLALSVPVVYFSPMFGRLLGYMPPGFPGAAWIPPVLGTVIFVYGGMPFLRGGLHELKARQPGMMLLIGMAISVAFAASWVTSLGIGGFDLDFWWELALLVAIMLLGHWIEMRALGSARGALDALAALLPDEAERITEAGTETVGVTELQIGDTLLVRSGARMPADGIVVDGAAEFDESMITGESKTVPHSPGDQVVAGTVATDNTVRVRVTAVGAPGFVQDTTGQPSDPCPGNCHSIQATTACCTLSATAGSLTAPLPGTTMFGAVPAADPPGSLPPRYSYLPGSPSPGELSISRT